MRKLLPFLLTAFLVTFIASYFTERSDRFGGWRQQDIFRRAEADSLWRQLAASETADTLYLLALVEPTESRAADATLRLYRLEPGSERTTKALFGSLMEVEKGLSDEQQTEITKAFYASNPPVVFMSKFHTRRGLMDLVNSQFESAKSHLATAVKIDTDVEPAYWDYLLALHAISCKSLHDFERVPWDTATLPTRTRTDFERLRHIWNLPPETTKSILDSIRYVIRHKNEEAYQKLFDAIAVTPDSHHLIPWLQAQAIVTGINAIDYDISGSHQVQLLRGDSIIQYYEKYSHRDTEVALSTTESVWRGFNINRIWNANHHMSLAPYFERLYSAEPVKRAALMSLSWAAAKRYEMAVREGATYINSTDRTILPDQYAWYYMRWLNHLGRHDEVLQMVQQIPPEKRSYYEWEPLFDALKAQMDMHALISGLEVKIKNDVSNFDGYYYAHDTLQYRKWKDRASSQLWKIWYSRRSRLWLFAGLFLIGWLAALTRSKMILKRFESAQTDRFTAVRQIMSVKAALLFFSMTIYILFDIYVLRFYRPLQYFEWITLDRLVHIGPMLFVAIVASTATYVSLAPLAGHHATIPTYFRFNVSFIGLLIVAPLTVVYLAYDLLDRLNPIYTFSMPTFISRFSAALCFCVLGVLSMNLAWLFKFHEMPAGEMRNKLEKLAHKLKRKINAFYVVDFLGLKIFNAFAQLRWLHKREVAFSADMLVEFTPDEIEAVAGHEFAHHELRHLEIRQGLFVILVALAMSISPLLEPLWDSSWQAWIMEITILFYFLFLATLLSRKHEIAADRFNVRHLVHPWAWRKAILKLQVQNFVLANEDQDTHPTIRQRLVALEEEFQKQKVETVIIDLAPVAILPPDGRGALQPAGQGYALACSLVTSMDSLSLLWPIRIESELNVKRFMYEEPRFYFSCVDGPGQLHLIKQEHTAPINEHPQSPEDRPQVQTDAVGVLGQLFAKKYSQSRRMIWFYDQVCGFDQETSARLKRLKAGQEWILLMNTDAKVVSMNFPHDRVVKNADELILNK